MSQNVEHTQNTPANIGIAQESSTLAYERLLAEQAARIADFQASLTLERERIAHLTAALEEARQELRNAQSEKADMPESIWQRWWGRRR